MAARVDVWDPSGEGPRIVEALRREGFDVRVTDEAEIPRTRAAVVVMTGEEGTSLSTLKQLRDDDTHGNVPVVLLGLPPGVEHTGEGPRFAADAVLARPVRLERLLARVRELLEGRPDVSRVHAPAPERTMQLSSPDDPASSQVLLRPDEQPPAAVWRVREPTLQLQDAPEISEVFGRSGPSSARPGSEERAGTGSSSTGGRGEPTGSRLGSSPGSGAWTGTDEGSFGGPEPEIPEERRAALSPRLEELFRAADRRVFPDDPPLVLHFPAADEPPEVLVPEELIEGFSLAGEGPGLGEEIDAFTYVGGPVVPPPIPPVPTWTGDTGGGSRVDPTPARPPSRPPITAPEAPRSLRGERTTATELPELDAAPRTARGASWPEDDTVLGRTAVDGSRRGVLGGGGALRLLWRIAALGLDAICELHLAGGPTMRMTFLGGELRAFEGSVATFALDELRRRGRAVGRPADEAGAEAVLQGLVDAGALGRFERDRLLGEARERLLVVAVRAERADFVLRRLDDTQPGRALSRARMLRRPLRAALVDAAREALDVARVEALLGEGEPGLALGPEREAGLAPAELPTEVVELLVRLDGQPLRAFLAAAPTELGLAGALYALVAGDALVLTDARPAPAPSLSSVVELLESAAGRALDADYFTILGLEPDAGPGALERAHRARRRELEALPLGALGLERMAGQRREALEALDEAYRALLDPDRRRRYAAALGPVLSR